MSELMAILAQVCGYHGGNGCGHCAETLSSRRSQGWTDEEIVADATLFRDDPDAWYLRAVEHVAAERAARGVPGV